MTAFIYEIDEKQIIGEKEIDDYLLDNPIELFNYKKFLLDDTKYYIFYTNFYPGEFYYAAQFLKEQKDKKEFDIIKLGQDIEYRKDLLKEFYL